jgi:probable F420-dependent oxidoreductase
MSAPLRFGIAIPQTFLGRAVEPTYIRDFVVRAEALGFDGAWVLEETLGKTPSLEPIEVLTYAAAFTSRIRLGTGVLLTVLRSPVHVAKSLTTLDHLCGGRLIVGVGLGGEQDKYPAYGITVERRAARFTEGIQLMRRLWTEAEITFDGEFWKLNGAAMEPKPRQKPHPPLWFGGHHPNAIRRAVELGDGFLGAGASSTARFAGEAEVLRRTLAAAGRDPASFPVSKRVYLALDNDEARAKRRLGEWFGSFYRNEALAEQAAVFGGPQQVMDGLAAVVAAGARMVVLNTCFDDFEQLERLVTDVLPKL